MMTDKELKVAQVLTASMFGFALIVVPAYALSTTAWDHPCESADLVCTDYTMHINCRCEADFDDIDNWISELPGNIVTKVTHSHDSVTYEKWVEMAYPDYSTNKIHTLIITAKDTGGNDNLELRFDPDSAGDDLHVAGTITLDATNGIVTLKPINGGHILTN